MVDYPRDSCRPAQVMPIVAISHKATSPAETLEQLKQKLPVLVSHALDCPEEPFDGHLQPGDVILRCVAGLPPEEGLDYLIEIRTRWTKSRSESLQERSDELQAALANLGVKRFGVWLELLEGAWSQ